MDIEEQESRDYRLTKDIIKKMFGESLQNIEKLGQYSAVDCAYTASTATSYKTYGMEIKETTKDLYKTDGFLLKVAKYIKIMKWSEETSHTPYIIYLCTLTNEYYIFNINDIKVDITNMVNMSLKVTQFKDSVRVDTPCIILPIKNAIAYGQYDF